jgi:ferritin-like metal-binding protein YciE
MHSYILNIKKQNMKTNSKNEERGTAAASKAVKTKSDASEGLRELLEDQLKDLYWAENALTKAIPKMIANATTPELVDALSEHLDVTEMQVTRLEEVFKSLGLKPEAKKCEAMNGLIKEADELMKSTEKGVVRDAGIISAAQKVEHYEIATYGTLRAFANTLGEQEAADLLDATLDEEKEADAALSAVAESINVEAAE